MRRALLSPAFIVSFLLLAGTAAAMAVLPGYMNLYLQKKPIESRNHMRSVAKRTASWEQIGTDRQESSDILKELGTHNTITRYYKQRNPEPGKDPYILELHLAYYTGMVDTVPHVPDRCMVGGGWVVNTGSTILPMTIDTSTWRRARDLPAGLKGFESATMARLPSSSDASAPGALVGLPLDLICAAPEIDDRKNNSIAMRITDFKDPRTQAETVIGYFFIANNRLTPRANEVRQLAFKLEDDYAYYVKVQVGAINAFSRDVNVRPVRSAQELADVASGFVSEILPEVMLCLPDWIKMETERLEQKDKTAQENPPRR